MSPHASSTLSSSRRRSRRASSLIGVATIVSIALVAVASMAAAAASNTSFGFNAGDVRGFPTGSVALTGGGTFDLTPSPGFVHSGGGFSCTSTVSQGPLTNCLAGEGVRWDTAALLSSTMFKCSAGEALQPVSTDDDTVVLQADFYRSGDANDESFTAMMIVSADDIDHGVDGVQNVWVQGVGCATATVHFSS
jgi:hypothetical protein